MSELTLLDELARQQEASPPVRDRLTVTLFVVAAVHAAIILGVTFAPRRPDAGSTAHSLEVLLVPNPVSEESVNTNADYLAQVNQRGSGTAKDVRGAESPTHPPQDPGADGEDPTNDATSDPGRAGDANVLSTRSASKNRRYFAHDGSTATGGSAPVVYADARLPEAPGADEGSALSLRGRTERELLVAANTRESSVAVYLDGWRRKIERIGTANYPLEAARRAGMTGSPVLEVQILSDGRLGEALVRRSSGHPELDQAAIAILKLAAPFEPFPRRLAAQHDALRLSYEWQFLGGELHDAPSRMPADTR